jgi:Uma2 family endonuclease
MTPPILAQVPDLEYPETDGKPMAENTLQYEWIVKIVSGLRALFANDPNVFVAGDLFWYPVFGSPGICLAPDALVAFGRPQGHRRSYKQWEEGGIVPQVVFEVLSPSNTAEEMRSKLEFYERYGVEEYYVYDPDQVHLTVYHRDGGHLLEAAEPNGWVSPRLGVRFDLSGDDMVIFDPNGRPFVTPEELAAQRDEEHEARVQAERAADRLRQQLRALGIEPQE